MNRRQLAFIVLVNAVVSLAIALGVAWAVEARRPDPEELAALYTPMALQAASATATPASVAIASPPPISAVVDTVATPSVADVAAPDVITEAVEPTTTPPPTLSPDEGELYIVQAGDSLLAIAERFGVTMDQIMVANGLKDANFLFSGQRLMIPFAEGQTSFPPTATPAATPVNGGAPASSSPGLQIQTIDAPGNLLNEAVLIVNESDLAFNLQGWRLEHENGLAYTFGSIQLFSGSSVWVHSSTGADTTIALYWKQPAPVWTVGSTARLLNPQGEVVVSYTVQ